MRFLPFPSAVAVAAAILAVLLSGCTAEARKARQLEKAEGFFRAGEFEKARLEYLNVLKADDKNSIAMERLATMWIDQGVPVRALPYLLRLKTVSPDNRGTRFKLAASLLAIGRISEARAEATAVLERWKDAADALFLLADSCRNLAEIEAASRALTTFPEKANARYLAASAVIQLLRGELDAARRGLQRAVITDPKSSDVHATLAKLHLREGDAVKAGEALKAAAEHAGPRSPATGRYAEFLFRTKGAKEAQDYLDGLLRQAPDYLPLRRLLANIALTEKKLDVAESQVKEMLARDRANVEAHLVHAQILLAKGEGKKAVAELEALHKQFPNFGVISLQLARAHLAERNPDQAFAVLEKGVPADPEHFESALALAELLIRRGKSEAAAQLLSGVLQLYPTLPQAQGMFITALRAMGRFDDAAKLVGEQIKQAPKNPQLHVLLGSIQRQQKKPAEAKVSFESALAVRADFMPAISELIELELAERQFDAALRRAEEWKARLPASPAGHYFAGRVQAAQAHWKEAETNLQKALEVDAAFGPAYDLLLQVYVTSNQLPRAIRQLEGTIAQNPKNERALNLAALIYTRMKDYGKARETYEKALALQPDSPPVLNNLAYLLGEHLHELDRALELASRARTLAPDIPAFADTLGWIHYRRKDYAAAVPLLQEAADKLPNHPEVRYHLGMALLAQGDKPAALQALRVAADSPQDSPDRSKAREQLAQLEKDPAAAAPAPPKPETK